LLDAGDEDLSIVHRRLEDGDGIESRRSDCRSRNQIEGGVMPGTADFAIDTQTFGERSPIVSTPATDSPDAIACRYDHDRLSLEMT
jgi:hypothetical protein